MTDRTSADDFLVAIGDHRFDPAETRRGRRRSPKPRRAAGAPDPADTRIVQFTQPLRAGDIDRIRQDYGLALTAFIPNLSYVERVDAATQRRLKRDPLVRAVAPYLPEYKIAPTVRTAATTRAALALEASLFDGGSTDIVREALVAAGARDVLVVDDRPIGGHAYVRFVVDDLATAERAAELDDIRWIELQARFVSDNVGAAATIQSGDAGNASIWAKGLHGEGQVIGVIDESPVDIAHCFFSDVAPNTAGPTHRKVLAIRNTSASLPTAHPTFVAGCAAGDEQTNSGNHANRGGAWAAKLVSGNFNDQAGAVTLLTELNAAMASGAFIHSNSWHDGSHGAGNAAPYTSESVQVDTFTFTNEDHLVLGSAGNTGNEQGSPGTAKNPICVSAAGAGADAMKLGSGIAGPTADRRRKPDLMTVGCGITSATVGTACGVAPDTCASSWATPHAAAAAALARQYFTEGWYPTGAKVAANAFTPTGSLLKAVLVNSTVDMTGVPGYPNDTEGWGLVRLERTLAFAGGRRKLTVWDVRHATGPTMGVVRTHNLVVEADTEQLKITLVWADSPGTAGAAFTVVNDLDVKVTAPNGTVYFGNDFTASGVSTPNGVGAGDTLNNVEVVVVNSPTVGTWTIAVNAFFVAVGNPGQGYSVVASATTKSGCFVAGAVYGDPDHPDVEALRAWRDRHLARGPWARLPMAAMVAAYRCVGPPAARVVGRRPDLRSALRRALPALARRAARGSPWA